MPPDGEGRVRIAAADLRTSSEDPPKVRVSVGDVAGSKAPPLPPPRRIVDLAHPDSEATGLRGSPERRTLIAIIALVTLILGISTAAAFFTGRSNRDLPPGPSRPIRVPTVQERALVDRRDLALVAPSVKGRSGGILSSEWGGTAIPWRIERNGRMLLVTNRHVGMADGAATPAKLDVEFADGVQRPVMALGVAEDAGIDLALLAVDPSGLVEGTHYRLVTPLDDAAWETLEPGQPVVAIGSPHGYPQTQTFGRISALRDHGPGFGAPGVRWVQIDCTVLPGNSGGPLLMAEGDRWTWIGVVTARGEPGIGFAIFSGELDSTAYRWISGQPAAFDFVETGHGS
jgi:S1-C subfamily serine protease